jgi:hypothetical protein
VIRVLRFEDNRIKEALDIATSPSIESVSMNSMRSLIDHRNSLPDLIAIPISLAASA